MIPSVITTSNPIFAPVTKPTEAVTCVRSSLTRVLHLSERLDTHSLRATLSPGVSESGSAAGAVEVGDVLIETVVTVMVKDDTGAMKFGIPGQVWHDTKDSSFEDCMTAMRTNQTELAMRLCRDYEPQGVIPLQSGAGLESWLQSGAGGTKSGAEAEAEAEILSGKAWAARNAAEVPLK